MAPLAPQVSAVDVVGHEWFPEVAREGDGEADGLHCRRGREHIRNLELGSVLAANDPDLTADIHLVIGGGVVVTGRRSGGCGRPSMD